MSTATTAGSGRLCPIYLRDVARLLSRIQVEELRTVSHYANTSILSTPEREMPRFTCPIFSIAVVSA